MPSGTYPIKNDVPNPWGDKPKPSDLHQLDPLSDLKDPWANENVAKVSDYMQYGSFSGADIKVIVHTPRSVEQEQNLQSAKSFFRNGIEVEEKKLQVIEERILTREDEIVQSIETFEALAALKTKDMLERRLGSIEDELATLLATPTSKVLGEIQTLSWSVYREKVPVRPLGTNYPRAYTRGGRTIGGTMVFTIFQQHVLHEILNLGLGAYSTGVSDQDRQRYTTMLPDQLPPLDISLIFANEFGAVSHMGLWGVEFVQEGGTFSIEDIFSESVVQYVCRDIDPMRIVEAREITGRGVSEEWSKTASNLNKEKGRLNGHRARRNPFI